MMLLLNNKILKILFIIFSINFFKKKKSNSLYNQYNWDIMSLMNIKYIYIHEIKLNSGNIYDISIFPISMILKPFSIYELIYNTNGRGVILGVISRKFFKNKIFNSSLVNYKNQLFFQIFFSLIKHCECVIIFKNFYFYQSNSFFLYRYPVINNTNTIIFHAKLIFKKFKIINKLFEKCKSFDQVKTFIILINTSLRNENSFLFINSIKGRGKSAILGFFC
mmetsp:Transcript_4183/g.8035  ORF Transcript_4183/g.8035 Transcript_4183/m.8035 type:complete len:221 (+) Transcript_4183:3-665(+)